MFEDGITDPNLIKERVRQIISQAKHLKEIQYIEIVDSNTLKPVDKMKKSDVLVVAVYIGYTRLIDNIEF